MTTEEWRPVVGYEGIYDVSSHGRVRRIRHYRTSVIGKILKPATNNKGYLRVCLYKDGELRQRSIHRLVAAAFIEECPEGLEANHIDGIRKHNHIDNLEYITHSENMRHAYRMGLQKPLRGGRNAQSKLTEKDVHAIRGLLGIETQIAIARQFGVSRSLVSHIATGRSWPGLKARGES